MNNKGIVMETTKAEEFVYEKLKSEWGLRILFRDVSDVQKPVFYRLMELYANEQTTSQKQTIERLEERIEDLIHGFKNLKCGYEMVIAENGLKDDGDFIKEAEQLLNTTEPSQQEPDEKYIVGINIDDKHYLHFRTTDLGFGIYAYDSEGNRVSCHAGKIYDGDFKHELYKSKVTIKGLLGKFEEQ